MPQEELEHHILKEKKTIHRRMASDKEGDTLADLRRISEWREKQLPAIDCAII
jgi:hypothetical protein